jgi:hypothetical protein
MLAFADMMPEQPIPALTLKASLSLLAPLQAGP